MSELEQERCVACRADSPMVTFEEIAELHPIIADWELTDEDSISRLKRSFLFRNFAEALAFSDLVGEVAEAEGHHPRIVTEWGRVTVSWWTHKIKSLHRNDFIMAAKTDQIYRWHSRSAAL